MITVPRPSPSACQVETLVGPRRIRPSRRPPDGFLSRAYGLDLRSLALFRIGLGALIIGDLIWRARDLRAFYTDFGVLPRYALLEHFLDQWAISLHLLSGQASVQALMFLVAAVFGLMLLVGYRTKLATIVSWAMLVSLQNRNPVVLQGGDIFFRMLLFWAVFLPLNAYYSLDRALDTSNAEYPQRVFTVGSLALMAQVAFVYWFTVLLKTGPEWRAQGSAVYYALSVGQFATPLGHFLLQFPFLYGSLTYLTLAIEVLAPVLLFWPFANGRVRTASILLMVTLHFGLWTTMRLGHFPLVATVAAIGLLPTWIWSRKDVLGDGRVLKAQAKRALTIYYDGGCEFCKKMLAILLTFVPSDGFAILRAQDNPAALADMKRRHSWVVEDSEGRRYFKSSALAVILRHSVWSPVAWLLERAPVRVFADRVYDWIARNRSPLARFLSPLSYRPLVLQTHWLASAVAGFFVFYALWWNIGTVNDHLAMPMRYRWIGMATRTDQKWDMFAPYPMKDDGWYVIPGVLQNGKHVDVFHDGTPVSFAPRSWSEIAGQYRDERWRKYLMNLYFVAFSDYRLYYGQYLCRKWNEGKAADDPKRLKNFDIYFMMRTNVPWTQAPKPYEKRLLWRHHCD